jgi:hypothetical protein
MSLNQIDMSQVEEPRDFGAVKPTVTRLRVREISIEPAPAGKVYTHYIRVLTEFVDPSAVEPVDAGTTPNAPIVNLYTHNQGSLMGLRRFIEALGIAWTDFVNAPDRDAFLQGLVGQEADAKIKLETHRRDTGEELDSPCNAVKFLKVKKA